MQLLFTHFFIYVRPLMMVYVSPLLMVWLDRSEEAIRHLTHVQWKPCAFHFPASSQLQEASGQRTRCLKTIPSSVQIAVLIRCSMVKFFRLVCCQVAWKQSQRVSFHGLVRPHVEKIWSPRLEGIRPSGTVSACQQISRNFLNITISSEWFPCSCLETRHLIDCDLSSTPLVVSKGRHR